jgi:small redox-active disulfide protein 2
VIIKILGSGCPNCIKLEANAKKAVEELGVEAVVEKITDMGLIIGYGVMSTPALVVDEKVLSYGRVPDVNEIKEILSSIEMSESKTEDNAPKSGGCSCGGKC